MRPLSAVLIIGFLLGGCSAAPRVAVKPEVAITDRQAHAQAGHATITLVNPNDHAIEVVEYHYTATASGESPWPGRHAGGLVLASGFEREVTLPVVLPPHVEHGTRGLNQWPSTLSRYKHHCTNTERVGISTVGWLQRPDDHSQPLYLLS